MFRFLKSDERKPTLTANQVVDCLEADQPIHDDVLDYFSKDHRTRHHNTFLLQALAWNRKTAALKLIKLDSSRLSIDTKDEWPTCQNTPMILAAKINDLAIVEQLILAGANVDEQDYRGYTALHYACLYRNVAMINRLLAAGADITITNAFGHQPKHYYKMEIKLEDLRYRYGYIDGALYPVSDMDNHYFSTNKKCLSAFRWYIPHLIANCELGKSITINSISLYDYAKLLLRLRQPINSEKYYAAMLQCFIDNRPTLNVDLLATLSRIKYTGYLFDHLDKYKLDVFDLAPRTAIQKIDDETWIEMQEFSKTSTPKC